jgi:hypothetical protein
MMVFYTNWFLMKGFSGATYCTPFIFIRPERKGDVGLLEHEKTHVKQFWKNPLMFLWYVFSKKARYAYELEAYRVQMKYSPERVYGFASTLATKYGLNLPIEKVLADLRA